MVIDMKKYKGKRDPLENNIVVPRKGQVFLIIAVFVLLAIILLKVETSQAGKQAFYSSLDWENSFDNIENEYQKVAEISLAQENTEWNLEKNLNNFSNFSLDSFNQRGYVFQLFYSLAFVNASNITVAVGNFYGDARNISINMSSGQSAFFSSIAFKQSNLASFPIADKFNATVSYFLNETAKNLTYSSDSNTTAAFHIVVRLQQADTFADEKLIFNKTSG